MTIANTVATYYLDTADAKKDCGKDLADMQAKCAPDDKNKARGKGRPKARKSQGDAPWVLDHCGPLMMQPGLKNFKEWREEFGDIQNSIKQMADALKDNVIAKLEQEALEYTGKQITKLAVRRGLTGWIPFIGWALTAVDVAVTAYDAVSKVQAIQNTVTELQGTVDRLREAANNIAGTFEKYKDQLKNFGNLSEAQQKTVAGNVMADIQAAYAAADPCLRARKCILVPFNKGTADKWAGKGCCPGQTGHHLLPDAMFRDPAGSAQAKDAWKADPSNKKADGTIRRMSRDKLPKRACWDGYSEGASPTICVEGTNQHMGSHGVIHQLTKSKLALGGHSGKADMSYTDARDLVVNEVSATYGCRPECLKEQLDAYYCGKAASKKPGCPDCKNAKVRPHDGNGEQPNPQEDDIEID